MEQRREIAEEAFAKLVAGESAEIENLGSFMIREYKAYEGLNPRTGEAVFVPRKRLVFFKVEDALRAHLNGDGPPPPAPWVAEMVAELQSKPVLFGRVGAFGRSRKVMMTFTPSRQLKRRLNDQPEPRVVDSRSVDDVLTRVPADLPATLAELDAALTRLGISHRVAGLVEPAERDVDGEVVLTIDADDEPTWFLERGSAVRRGVFEGKAKFTFKQWAGDMLVVAAIRSFADGGVLEGHDIERVLARLGRKSPFGASDLPY